MPAARTTFRCGTLFLAFALLAGCDRVSSTTVDLGGGAQLIFSIRWSWGMEQTLSLAQGGRVLSEKSEEVWKRPYWSGGPLYADAMKERYYLALRNGLYQLDIAAGEVKNVCSLPAEQAALLVYVGQFSLTEMQKSTRGDGVTFTPAGQSPPVESGVKADREAFKGRCG
jgi:hypothetical protein